MNRFLRYLRIAFSAACLVAAVLLCALWVRSYWNLDVWVQNNSTSTIVRSDAGLITFSRMKFGSSLTGHDACVHIVDTASVGMIFWQFDWSWQPDIFLVRTPIWVPALAGAMLAGIPWIRWSKQFSIRTMLIVTALVALVLGMVVSFQ